MRVAQVAPLYESVPPAGYGGTERVVSYLTEALVELGVDVTLFATADSITRARLVPCCARGLRELGLLRSVAHHLVQLEHVFRRAAEFDLVHFHTDFLHFPLSRRHRLTAVTTLHGRLDLPELVPVYREFADQPLVSISDAQRAPLPWANWVRTIHHGLPETLYRLHERPGDYLAFIGRIAPEKRVDRAIEIARRAGMPLKIAAKVDLADRAYYEQRIRPMLKGRHVEFVGEIGQEEKDSFLGRAVALLFPIDWPEPFGLVMIEAMACGTPVIAWPCGSVREVIEPGVTGFIVDDIDDAAEACDLARRVDRAVVRGAFERRFTARRMALDYLELYAGMASCDRELAGRRETP